MDRSRIISPRIAATTASTATFCGRSPTPTAPGARRPGADIVERHRAMAGADADRARRRAAGAAQGRVHRQGRRCARSRRGRSRPIRDYEAHAERLAMLIGELLRVQRGARLAADMAAGPSRRAGVRGRLHPRQARRRRRRFQRPDRMDARACSRKPGMGDWVRYKLDRAGRPCAGRRGAGHQCRAMGDHRAAGRGIFQRLERDRAAAPDLVHGRRLQAGDLRLPGHRPAALREAREQFRRARRAALGATRRAIAPRASSATCRSPPASARRSRCSTWSMR